MKRWAILFGLLIVLIVILADTRHLGFLGIVYDFPYGDKAGHFILFGLLSMLVNLAVFEAKPAAGRIWLALGAGLVLAGLMALEEFSQRWAVSRTFSLWDLAAGCAGVALFGWLAIRIDAQKRKSSGN